MNYFTDNSYDHDWEEFAYDGEDRFEYEGSECKKKEAPLWEADHPLTYLDKSQSFLDVYTYVKSTFIKHLSDEEQQMKLSSEVRKIIESTTYGPIEETRKQVTEAKTNNKDSTKAYVHLQALPVWLGPGSGRKSLPQVACNMVVTTRDAHMFAAIDSSEIKEAIPPNTPLYTTGHAVKKGGFYMLPIEGGAVQMDFVRFALDRDVKQFVTDKNPKLESDCNSSSP